METIHSRVKEPIMKLKAANCKNCYKCVRACPVKAIRILNERAEIVEDRCIYCGKCYVVCPQDARDLVGDLDRVKMMIHAGEKVYFSVSSSLSIYFPEANLRSLAVLLKKLGAARVEEMAIGTGRMLQEYSEILYHHDMKNVISSYCPSTNFLIEKYYPHLTQWLIPVETPLEIHARMMRAAYGEDIRVVGVGSCIAYHKLANIAEDGRLIDAYLTFEEMEEWFQAENLQITEEEDPETGYCSNYRWRYPDEPQGLSRALPGQIKYNYNLWEMNGETKAASMFRHSSEMNNSFMTITACSSSCLGGPISRLHQKDDFISKDRWLTRLWKEVSRDLVNPSEAAEVEVRKEYDPLPFEQKLPEKEDLQYILSLVGIQNEEDMLNCGGCGYSTCVEKAVAVYQGMADPFMCIPNARDKAEAQSNLLFDNSPNGVLVFDQNFRILDANAVAQQLLGADVEALKGKAASDYLNDEFLTHARYKESEVIRETVECEKIDKILSITFFKIKRHDIAMAILYDRTDHARRIQKVDAMREETISVTQDVIEKQMRIAQEIASLLGETTAESKLAFNRLKNLLIIGDDDNE